MELKPQAEYNDKLFENSIKYLHNISNMSELNIPVLKSFYSTRGRLMGLKRNIYLSSNLTKASVRCQRCCINLLDGPASYKINAERKKSKFARRMLVKRDNDKPLTKYQQKYLRRLNTFDGNELAITCGFCKKESLIKLQKPAKIMQPKVAALKRKRNKRRDKFCGLRQDVVLSLTPQNVKRSDNSTDADNNTKSGKKGRACDSVKKSLTSPNIRDLDSSYVSVNANVKKTSKLKLRKKENLPRNNSKIAPGNNKSKLKVQKRNKSLHKLSEFMTTSNKEKAGPSSNLKHFLQSL